MAVARSSGQGDLPSALHYHWGPPKRAPSREPSPSAWRKKKGRGQEGELREGRGRGREEGDSWEFTKEGEQLEQGEGGAGAPAQLPGDAPSPPTPQERAFCAERQAEERQGRQIRAWRTLGWGVGGLLLGEGDTEPLPPAGVDQPSCFPPCPLPIHGDGGGLVAKSCL